MIVEHADLQSGSRNPIDAPGQIELRLEVPRPFAFGELLSFLAVRAVPGAERSGPGWYERSLRLPHGQGAVRFLADSTEPDSTGRTEDSTVVTCLLWLRDPRDVSAAEERCRQLLGADADPVAVDAVLSTDPRLAPLVSTRPGLRVPGHVDGNELAIRAVLGQQVSVGHARALAGLLVERYGEPLDAIAAIGDPNHSPEVTHLFPTADVLAVVDPEDIPMPRARGRALNSLCTELASGQIRLDRSADRIDVRDSLLALPGIGPWTAGYIAMRALGDPDAFLPTDIGVRNALKLLGENPKDAEQLSQAWRPWRSHAQMHLWASLVPTRIGSPRSPTKEK